MNINDLIKQLQSNGIPIILLKCPKTKEPSLSLTLVVISAFFVVISILSNFFAFLKGINHDQALDFFMTSCALYFGRGFSSSKGSLEK